MTRDTKAKLGIIASVLVSIAGASNQLPPSWAPYIVLAGIIGTGISAWLHSTPGDPAPSSPPKDDAAA